MNLSSENPVWADVALENMQLLVVGGGGAACTAPKVHLFTAGPGVILPTWRHTDFTEATYTGYPAGGLTMTSLVPVNLPSGLGRGLINPSLFIPTAAPASPGISILGYWADDVTAGPLVAELFQVPVSLVNLGDYLDLELLIGNPYVTPAS